MKAEILRIVAELKELVREMDDANTSESSLEEMYDKLNQIEDTIYDDDLGSETYEQDDNY